MTDTYHRDQDGDLSGVDRRRRRHGRRAREHCERHHLCDACWAERRSDALGDEYHLGYGLRDGGVFFNDAERRCRPCIERYLAQRSTNVTARPGQIRGRGSYDWPGFPPRAPESVSRQQLFRVTKPYPGLEVGAVVVIDRGAPKPIMLWRALTEEDVAGAEIAGCLTAVGKSEAR